MSLAQRLRVDVREKRLPVGAVEEDARAQLRPQEWLEHREQHIEDKRLVYDVNLL